MPGLSSVEPRFTEKARSLERGTGQVQLVNTKKGGIGRGALLPGWRWSEHVTPITGSESRQAAHIGYVISRLGEGRHGRQGRDWSTARDLAVMPPGQGARAACILVGGLAA